MRKLNEFDATRYVDVILFVAVVLFSLDFATLARCGRHLLELDIKQNCIYVSKNNYLLYINGLDMKKHLSIETAVKLRIEATPQMISAHVQMRKSWMNRFMALYFAYGSRGD